MRIDSVCYFSLTIRVNSELHRSLITAPLFSLEVDHPLAIDSFATFIS